MSLLSDEETLKSWLAVYSDKMYSWVFYKTGDKESSEDLVQDTFLAAFKSIQQFEGKSDPKTWLFAILNNKIAEHFRKIYRSPVLSNRKDDHSEKIMNTFFNEDEGWLKEEIPRNWLDEKIQLLDDHDFKSELENCMKNLPPKWNAALQLKYLEEKKGEVICQELEITASNFWQILHRAKLQLRKCLDIKRFRK